MITDIVLDQSMVGRALHANALVAVGDLRCVSSQLRRSDGNAAYFIIVDPVVLANRVNSIVAPEIGSSDCEMVHFDVSPKLENEVEFRTIHQDEIVEARIDWRYDPNQTRALRTFTHQHSRATSDKGICRLTCLHCKRWVRLMGDDCTRATSHGSCRDLFRATTVSSRCISPRGVAQIPAACTTRSALSLCTTTCGGTGGSQPKCEPLTSYCYDTRYGPQGKLSKIAFKCSVSI